MYTFRGMLRVTERWAASAAVPPAGVDADGGELHPLPGGGPHHLQQQEEDQHRQELHQVAVNRCAVVNFLIAKFLAFFRDPNQYLRKFSKMFSLQFEPFVSKLLLSQKTTVLRGKNLFSCDR
jgi:hypothetical protein